MGRLPLRALAAYVALQAEPRDHATWPTVNGTAALANLPMLLDATLAAVPS